MKQSVAKELADEAEHIVLICGRYEGFDERVLSLVDEEISVGDFVLTGGEIPALLIIDGVVRLLPPEKASKTLKVGEFTRARIVAAEGHDLVGLPI